MRARAVCCKFYSSRLSCNRESRTLQEYVDGTLPVDGVLEVEIPRPFSINAVPKVSAKAKRALLKRKVTIDPTHRELVVPVLVDSRQVEFTPTSVYAAQASIPKKLRLVQHQIDLAFAVTDYKLQGKTLDYLILSIGPRDGDVRPSLTLTDVYVLVSRVRLGTRLYVIGFDPSDPRQTEHLRRLSHPAELAVWEKGYDQHTRLWDAQLARAAAAALVADANSSARGRGRGVGRGVGPGRADVGRGRGGGGRGRVRGRA